jgi:hypothetical protein
MFQYLWTPERDDWLTENAPKKTIKELQAHLKINKDAIKNRCNKLGVKWKIAPSPGKPKSWTEDQESRLMNLAKSGYSFGKIAKALCKTEYDCQKQFLAIQERNQKITLTLEEIIGILPLTNGQKEMAQGLFKRYSAGVAYNYVMNIKNFCEATKS